MRRQIQQLKMSLESLAPDWQWELNEPRGRIEVTASAPGSIETSRTLSLDRQFLNGRKLDAAGQAILQRLSIAAHPEARMRREPTGLRSHYELLRKVYRTHVDDLRQEAERTSFFRRTAMASMPS
jgi:hypothetical protein